MGKAVVTTSTRGHCGAVQGPLWQAGLARWPADFAISESSGIYVPPADAAALRDAMRFLLSNPEVASELGRNGRRRVEAEFTVDKFAARFAETILGVMPTSARTLPEAVKS
jgi:rhamnosyl/mannosyltransferase